MLSPAVPASPQHAKTKDLFTPALPEEPPPEGLRGLAQEESDLRPPLALQEVRMG
jgi:hypothetical protein